MHTECVLVSRFLSENAGKWFQGGPPNEAAAVIEGQFLRVRGWLRSLEKLNEPSDFQAMAAATRALFEIAVDIVLLASERNAYERLLDWEQCIKAKHGAASAAYYRKIRETPESFHQPQIIYAERKRDRVAALQRKHGWKHVDRWTGRKLDADAREAGRHCSDFPFERFYETEYRPICTMVHGSGHALTRNLDADTFPALPMVLLQACANLSVVCAELTLKAFGRWDLEKAALFGAMQRVRSVEGYNARQRILGLPTVNALRRSPTR